MRLSARTRITRRQRLLDPRDVASLTRDDVFNRLPYQFVKSSEVFPADDCGVANAEGIGLRTTFWQFDHASAIAAPQPPDNGFGLILHPFIGDFQAPLLPINVGSGIPTDQFLAQSSLNAYTIELEVTKRAEFGAWELLVGGGIRYARAALLNGDNDLVGLIDYAHSILDSENRVQRCKRLGRVAFVPKSLVIDSNDQFAFCNY